MNSKPEPANKEHPFFKVVAYARQYRADELLPVSIPARHRVKALIHADAYKKLQDLSNLAKSPLIQFAQTQVILLPGITRAREVTAGFARLAMLLRHTGIIKKLRDEKCRLRARWDDRRWSRIKNFTPEYPRDLRSLFGLPIFGTHCIGYTRHMGNYNIILGISGKEGSNGQFDFTFGGNLESQLTSRENLRKEAREETVGVILLNDHMEYRHASGFKSKLETVASNLRTIKQDGAAIRNGIRRISALHLPARIHEEINRKLEEDTGNEKKEVATYVSVPLKTLLEAWTTGDENHRFAMKNFKHAVPISILAFAIEHNLIDLSARDHARLKRAIHDPVEWKARGTVAASCPT